MGRGAVRAALPALDGQPVARARPDHTELLADAHRALRAARHSGACASRAVALMQQVYHLPDVASNLQAPPFDMNNECTRNSTVHNSPFFHFNQV